MNSTLIVVALQIALMWSVLISVTFYAKRRDGRAPLDDLGFFWLLALTLYSTLSPLSWLLQGGEYSVLSGRLFRLQPEPSEIVSVLNVALGFAIAFAAAYLRVRKRVGPPSAMAQAYIGDTKLTAAVAIIALGLVFGIVLGSTGFLRSADSYADSYAVMQSLPLGLRQILKVVTQFQLIATIVLIVALIQRWPRSRALLLLYLFSVALTFDPEGPRTVLARSILTVVIAWHVLIRPISFTRFIAGGTAALIVFMLLGVWRALGALGGAGNVAFDGIILGEFDVLWGNAIELWQIKQSGQLELPADVRFGEFFEFLPSQLLWFEKSSLSIWYLDTYYAVYKAGGGGLAFGALTQAAVGGGVLEAVIRGAVLGTLAGWLMKWIRKPSHAWWHLPLYLYLVVTAYQSVRDTTFSVLAFLIQGVIPALIFIACIAAVFSGAQRPLQDKHAA